MFCTAPSCGHLAAHRSNGEGCAAARRVALNNKVAPHRPSRSTTLRCDASSSSDAGSSPSSIPDRLPLAGADTDWREFRARLVASESAPASASPWGEGGAGPSGNGLLGLDAHREGFWAHALPGPEKGGLLLAHPLMFQSSQQYFRQAAIFLFEHGPEGSAGLILNLPTGHTIGSLGANAAAACPEFAECPLHLGGDVGDSTLHMMSSVPLQGSLEVGSGVYMGGYDAALRVVREGREHPSSFKWFCKYSGWAPGQLQREVDAGVWFTAAAGRGVVLQQAAGRSGPEMWHQVLELMGGEYRKLSEAVRAEYRPDVMGHNEP